MRLSGVTNEAADKQLRRSLRRSFIPPPHPAPPPNSKSEMQRVAGWGGAGGREKEKEKKETQDPGVRHFALPKPQQASSCYLKRYIWRGFLLMVAFKEVKWP